MTLAMAIAMASLPSILAIWKAQRAPGSGSELVHRMRDRKIYHMDMVTPGQCGLSVLSGQCVKSHHEGRQEK